MSHARPGDTYPPLKVITQTMRLKYAAMIGHVNVDKEVKFNKKAMRGIKL